MGKKAGQAIGAREKARERLLALNADRVARDQRIEAATIEAITAAEQVDAARATAQEQRQARRQELTETLARIDQAETGAIERAESSMAAAVGRLQAEKMSVAEIAELVALPLAEVRRLLRTQASAGTAPSATPDSARDTAADAGKTTSPEWAAS